MAACSRWYRDTVMLPDGGSATREYIKHPGAVVIVAVLPDGKLVFERQFRYPVGEVFLELPAGKLDPDETLLACAQRELLEETGYRAGHWQHLGVMHPCIGYPTSGSRSSSRAICTSKARSSTRASFEIVSMSYEEAEAAVLDGSITDAKTITALFRARQPLAGRHPTNPHDPIPAPQPLVPAQAGTQYGV